MVDGQGVSGNTICIWRAATQAPPTIANSIKMLAKHNDNNNTIFVYTYCTVDSKSKTETNMKTIYHKYQKLKFEFHKFHFR